MRVGRQINVTDLVVSSFYHLCDSPLEVIGKLVLGVLSVVGDKADDESDDAFLGDDGVLQQDLTNAQLQVLSLAGGLRGGGGTGR